MDFREDRVTYLGRVNARNRGTLFGIKRADRRSHMYVIGRTGTGKSTLLLNMIRQDMIAGEGLAVFDPHGDMIHAVRSSPSLREVVIVDPADLNSQVGFNPLEGIPPLRRPLAAANLVEIFRKIWADSWGPRMEHVLRNTFLALLEVPGASFADIPRLYSDSAFRSGVTGRLTNPQVRAFWTEEFKRYPLNMRAQVTAPIQNKAGAFLADERIMRFLGGRERRLQVREIMDSRGVLLVNLSKGELGEGPAALIGSLLVASIGLAGLARADLPEGQRKDFQVYLDEYPAYATLSLANMLSELRKYRVNLVLAHQYLSQVDTAIRDAALGNAGTLIAFRVGAQDAPFLAREFLPELEAEDLLRLPNRHIYLKLMIDGAVSRPFSATTLKHIDESEYGGNIAAGLCIPRGLDISEPHM